MNSSDFDKMVKISPNRKYSLLAVKEFIPSPKENFAIGGEESKLQKQHFIESKKIMRQVTIAPSMAMNRSASA